MIRWVGLLLGSGPMCSTLPSDLEGRLHAPVLQSTPKLPRQQRNPKPYPLQEDLLLHPVNQRSTPTFQKFIMFQGRYQYWRCKVSLQRGNSTSKGAGSSRPSTKKISRAPGNSYESSYPAGLLHADKFAGNMQTLIADLKWKFSRVASQPKP